MIGENILAESWRRVTNGEAHYLEFFDLVCRYTASERFHHNLEHIKDMISSLIAFELEQPDRHNYGNLHRAIWWHDAIYDAQRKDNEEQSAELAAATLTGWRLQSEDVAQVRSLILATKNHDSQGATDAEKLMIFLDLSILATSPLRYRLYAENIRLEYSWVDDIAYAAGRSQFLTTMLSKPNIFPDYPAANYMEILEQNARHNILAELEWISAKEADHGH